MGAANEEQAGFWSERAASWLASEERVEPIISPPGARAIERLGPQPGERVLDVGCGSGRTTVALAALVQPGGHALGLDIAPEMIAFAQAHAPSGDTSVDFRVGDAQVCSLEPVDAIFSRFGVMFFADPPAAFANLRSALTARGRVAFVCWQDVFHNEWMLVPVAATSSALAIAPPTPVPGAPGPFAFADPARVRSILAEAGFSTVEIETCDDTFDLPSSDVDRFAAQCIHLGAVREMLLGVPDPGRAIAAIEEALRSRIVNGVVPLSRGYHVVFAA